MAGDDFKNFVVVVTGASTGLGRAIAVEVASRGAAAVIVNYARSEDEAQETARQVEAHGARAVLVQGDVASDEDCRKIAAAAEPFGRIDALFNNAGVTTFAPNHADLGCGVRRGLPTPLRGERGRRLPDGAGRPRLAGGRASGGSGGEHLLDRRGSRASAPPSPMRPPRAPSRP